MDGENVKYTYEKIGTFTAKLRVTDNNDNYSFAEKQITIKAGENPQAVITINSDNGQFEKGKSYLFDAGKSASPVDAQIVKYLWDFGDGSVANTRTANHSFVNVGKFTVKLTVTDENGLKGDDSSDVTIIEPKSAPIAVIMPTPGFTDKEQTYIEGEAPLSVTFSGLNSRDKDKDIIEYKWDFDGDGVTDDSGDVVKNIFKEQGEYQVTLTVIDSEKNESKASIIVKVKAHGIEAVLTASPIEGEVPLKVNFDASGSSFPEGKIISYEWDFGNGTKRIDISQISYTYNAVGTYTAKVTAVGSDGSKSEANVVVSIRPVSLKACFNMTPSIGDAPLDVQFDASCAGGTVAYYLWNFGNGKTSRDRKPIATYSKPGNYEITLEVRDQNGITDSTTKNVVVTGVVE
ncbi:MAG: PKD domain containing protein [Candidatus Peregrinibacteria bacterium GW2011_GWF2_33_10]|nr:MAG: PKD domain containing protein [Candidatus Peregrinibacteria bacterium GW2011_GWF2_33_10]